ncbi:MocR-like pyridoxine biosynthesis transcription factor PdxR [Pectobacterium aroidearum]|uniref:MocR-like pyridoxine biosynthesis transcription factor PdxR n=1 Tax=Pectobacterium aroidearum TaxID=1201031 RepID=UPI002115CD00|nr:PLP-dependent aminotransferase family protein [Pectobacterium aroidearum]UUE45804.1 PLP-dependent aminotransferase family protein [Pectobacterium aroidearum]UUE50025.1 PLP-dependent aminotransferase family protein [Pectobacterium aroidearum]UUE54230.1 PLP-dependent aminotransferase family protein [Pectobacterium aroidearum]UUE62638.1 PLP-dependent aminotransferase family protein [Pectobacterium aroidearum]UUE66861.1 PLP-dependent aminotransferase family protein [Pectobacterium aroidearum]
MDMQQLKPSREHDAPLYLQLYRRYRDAITAGKLHPGDRVPSVRSLASELNLARGTVEMAYQMLASEGYFLTRGPAGTIVSPRLENLGESGHVTTSLSQIPTRPQTEADQEQPFQLGLPALDAFPRKSWARLAGHNLRTLDTAAMIYPDPAGYEPLRRAIATYLGISRGITCTYEQVFITAGYRGALELVCRTLLQPGDSGWFEDPGYLFARQFLERAGMHLEPVPVDEEGLNVDMGQQRAAEARFAVVTPTHQSPMGVALSLPRRLQLLEWASHRRSWIIEDDYDSEFRYHGRPLPALKSLDRDGRVLYTGTFSKVLFPGLRLAYLVVPEPQIERFKDTANHFCCPGSILPQATVATFMEQGHFARHLRRMRSLYAIRRGYLVDELLQTLGSHLIVQPQAGGIHVLAKLATRGNDQSLAAAAQSHGLAIQALNDWRMSRSSQGGLLMGFTNVTEPAMAKALVHQLAVAIGLS